MKLIVKKTQLNSNPETFLRKAGYAFIHDRRSGNDSFVRRLGQNFYPRLHMYIKQEGDDYIFNLHLDQKQASYAGSHAHSAEYDGTVVESEINRLRSFLGNIEGNNVKPGISQKTNDPLDSLGSGEYDKNIKPEPKKSWIQRIFS